MPMTRHTMRAVVALATMLFSAALGAAGFKVVVHPSTEVSTLTKSELSDYLLKRKLTWPNGKAVIPVDLPEKSEVRAAVVRDVFGRSASAIKSYWNQQIFSGRAIPPAEKASDEQVVAFIESSPGAIGYVSTSAPVGRLIVVPVR